MTYTTEQIRMLAEVERKMDAGEQPFVLYGGHRLAVNPATMAHLALAQGQTISDAIALAVAKHNVEMIEAEIAARRQPN